MGCCTSKRPRAEGDEILDIDVAADAVVKKRRDSDAEERRELFHHPVNVCGYVHRTDARLSPQEARA